MSMRSALGLLVVAVGLSCAAPAWAGDAAAAEALFDQGRAAMDKKDYDTACSKFRESQRLDPAPGTMLNLANCEEQRGKLATAWELYRGAIDKLPSSDTRVAVAQERADALKKRLPKLTVSLADGAPAGTSVKRDDVKLEGASLGTALPVNPGKHTLTVSAPGHAPKTYDVDLAEGENKSLDVEPGPEGAGAGGAVGGGAESHAGGGSSHTLGYVLGGVGVAGVVVGSITGIMALGKHSTVTDPAHCDQNSRVCDSTGADAASSGKTLGAITTVSWIVGAVGIGAGAYFLLSSDSKDGGETALVTNVRTTGPSVALVRTW